MIDLPFNEVGYGSLKRRIAGVCLKEGLLASAKVGEDEAEVLVEVYAGHGSELSGRCRCQRGTGSFLCGRAVWVLWRADATVRLLEWQRNLTTPPSILFGGLEPGQKFCISRCCNECLASKLHLQVALLCAIAKL
jgi:hypothetical protein